MDHKDKMKDSKLNWNIRCHSWGNWEPKYSNWMYGLEVAKINKQ
jgi:hypothetical protein